MYFVSLVISACKKDPLLINTNIIDKSPIFSELNSTTSSSFLNRHFPGNYYTLEKAYNSNFQINQISLINADYRFDDVSRCYLDFNGDDKLDLFGFLTNFKDEPYASSNGKWLIVSDLLGDNPQIRHIDANWRWGFLLTPIDVNEDGRHEVIAVNSEDHSLSDGTFGPTKPLPLIEIDDNLNVSIRFIGESVSAHAQTFGDIDNDGDVDIINWRNPFNNPNGLDLPGMPILYTNDGNGNFTTEDSFTRFKNLNSIIPIMGNNMRKNYPITAMELFDIDKDNQLDLVVSYVHNRNIPSWEFGHQSTRIYWGEPGGFFDFANNFTDLPLEYLNHITVAENIPMIQLGFSFLDYNQDGNVDIFTVTTPDYGGSVIQLCKNNGSRSFSDVTNSQIVDFDNIYPRNSQSANAFPHFNKLRIYDKDSDGDYDLVPDNLNLWGLWEFPVDSNRFWKNNNGSFELIR